MEHKKLSIRWRRIRGPTVSTGKGGGVDIKLFSGAIAGEEKQKVLTLRPGY